MKVELLPSTVGEPANRQFCIGAVINDDTAIDAGTLGLVWPVERQQRIRRIFLSHSHIDHVASLPLLLDNVYTEGPQCPMIYGNAETLQALRDHLFNDRIWPDFVRLSELETPFLELELLQAEQSVAADNLKITPVSLNHVVPTLGFIVQEGDVTVAFVSDTGPTERVWELLSQQSHLQAVFFECSFPNSHSELAAKSGHLCPETFASELQKLPQDVRVIACHLKPAHYDAIVAEIAELQLPQVEIGQPGVAYDFLP